MPSGQYTRPSVEARFWGKVDKSGSCWEWRAGLGRKGYGKFSYGKRTIMAHRMSWILNYGAVPDGLHVLHHCDNVLCVHPQHLWLGTNLDNIADKCAKGRQAKGLMTGPYTHPERHPRGERIYGHKLTTRDVIEILKLRDDGFTLKAIASRFGVGWTSIRSVLNGKTWSHITSINRLSKSKVL